MISYKFDIKRFKKATKHLSLQEDLVLRRLLDYYYLTEKPIPDEAADVIKLLRLEDCVSVFHSVLQEFFFLLHDGWHNSYADYQIEKYYLKLVESHAEKAMMDS